MQSPFCFPALSERVVILTWTDDAADPQTARSAAAFAMLKEERDACGRPFKVHKMPQPGPLRITQTESATIDASPGMTRAAGSRLAGSYVNFLITNGLVVMPSLDARTDDDALCLMASIFPHHRVLGVPSQSPQSTILWASSALVQLPCRRLRLIGHYRASQGKAARSAILVMIRRCDFPRDTDRVGIYSGT